MPSSTYTLIKSDTLTSSAASYTFTAIPSTYTDLVVRFTGRLDGGAGGGVSVIRLNSSALSMSVTYIYTNYSYTLTSSMDSASTTAAVGYINDGGSTSNTFSNSEIYIPNYSVAGVKKQVSTIGGMEYDASAFNYGFWSALQVIDTAAITSIELDSVTGGSNFVSGSSFYLYGISKS